MFFGSATQHSDACHLLNLASERGVNFFDTAEMYPTPQAAEHQGQSEAVLGSWLKAHRRCATFLCMHLLPQQQLLYL